MLPQKICTVALWLSFRRQRHLQLSTTRHWQRNYEQSSHQKLVPVTNELYVHASLYCAFQFSETSFAMEWWYNRYWKKRTLVFNFKYACQDTCTNCTWTRTQPNNIHNCHLRPSLRRGLVVHCRLFVFTLYVHISVPGQNVFLHFSRQK